MGKKRKMGRQWYIRTLNITVSSQYWIEMWRMVPYSLFSKSCSTEYTQIGTVQKPPYCICLHYCYFPWFYMSCTYIMFHCYVLDTTCIALLAYCHDIASYTDTKLVHLGLHFAANPLTCTTFGSQHWSRQTNFGQDFFYDTTLMCTCMYP